MEPCNKTALRSRVVTFRLTDEEYESLKNLCDENASSISETSRNAVLALIPAVAAASSTYPKFESFGQKLDRIIALLSASMQRDFAAGGAPLHGQQNNC